CLDSLASYWDRCVYVDSGSTDQSTKEAEARGVKVLGLDMSKPFTAARARNAGFRELTMLASSVDKVHLIDGDCEVHDGWVSFAERFMDENPDVGVVLGLQQERHPQASIYNQLIDIE